MPAKVNDGKACPAAPTGSSDEDGFTAFADVIAVRDAASPIIGPCPGSQAEIFKEHAEVIVIAARNVHREVIVISPPEE